MTTILDNTDAIARTLAGIAVEAGALLQRLRSQAIVATVKPDGTPASEADLAAETLILKRLTEIWPDIPSVAEESGGAIRESQPFFLIDPLDGTRDYLTPEGEYSVNIALIVHRRPVAAVIAAPANRRVWIAGTVAAHTSIPKDAAGALDWEPICTRPRPMDGLIVLGSRRHGDAVTQSCLATLPVRETKTVSSAVKFGLIACGEADLYIRCGATMEWDTAAGDHILERAGGGLIAPDGSPFLYGRVSHDYRNGPFAAFGDTTLRSIIALPRHIS